MLPLDFPFPLNVPYSCKSANKIATAACKEPISQLFSFTPFQVIVKYNS